MYLEHISVVHSVQGDISRTAALEKPGCSAPGAFPQETGRARQVATSEISSHSSRLGAPSAPSSAKALPDRCCSQSVLSYPTTSSSSPNPVLGVWRDNKPPLPLLHILTASHKDVLCRNATENSPFKKKKRILIPHLWHQKRSQRWPFIQLASGMFSHQLKVKMIG